MDQTYRRGWSTLRENTFAYVKVDGEIAALQLVGRVYYHDSVGRGDWLPPYLVDVADDGSLAESEPLALRPLAGCPSSILFPYGGAGPEADPACHPRDARAVQSNRHTHYGKTRGGGTVDFEWHARPASGIRNRLRAGGLGRTRRTPRVTGLARDRGHPRGLRVRACGVLGPVRATLPRQDP